MSARPLYQLQIRTPEGVTFTLQLAGPIIRFIAWLTDLACILAISIILRQLAGVLAVVSADFAGALQIYLYFAVTVGYGITLEWGWRGQTFGKRMMRLRVMDADGLHLRFSQVVMRNLLRIVDALPLCYGVGGVACLIGRRAQRLGDLAAGTVVVRYPRLEEPTLEAFRTDKFNSLAALPVHAARLRQAVRPDEAALLVQALEQREKLRPQARLELYRELADYMRAKTAFPQEATDGLSDEHYLRNVVSTVYRLKSS